MVTLTDGVIRDNRVKYDYCAPLDHGPIGAIHAIVVHQTGSPTAKGTIAGYKQGGRPDGAHFLIDTDGTIYQCVPVTRKCWHVGQLKARCIEEHTCDQKTQKKYDEYKQQKGWTYQKNQMYHDERQLPYPQRYPENEDSIGIEIVSSIDHSGDVMMNGRADHRKDKFVFVTPEEQKSLDWLIQQLLDSLHLTRKDIYRHAQVSYKMLDEAQSAHF